MKVHRPDTLVLGLATCWVIIVIIAARATVTASQDPGLVTIEFHAKNLIRRVFPNPSGLKDSFETIAPDSVDDLKGAVTKNAEAVATKVRSAAGAAITDIKDGVDSISDNLKALANVRFSWTVNLRKTCVAIADRQTCFEMQWLLATLWSGVGAYTLFVLLLYYLQVQAYRKVWTILQLGLLAVSSALVLPPWIPLLIPEVGSLVVKRGAASYLSICPLPIIALSCALGVYVRLPSLETVTESENLVGSRRG